MCVVEQLEDSLSSVNRPLLYRWTLAVFSAMCVLFRILEKPGSRFMEQLDGKKVTHVWLGTKINI